jgi:hypothetical protein
MVFSFSGRQTGRRSQADYAELLKRDPKQQAAQRLEPGIIRDPA